MLSLIPWKRNSALAEGTWMLPLHPVRHEMNRLVDELVNGFPTPGLDDAVRVEVRETADELIVRAEVPGIDPKDLDIRLTGDVLVLSGEKKDERDENQEGALYSERRYGTFRRALRLAAPIDAEKVRAEHKNGVVTITLAKAESVRPRRIEVRGS